MGTMGNWNIYPCSFNFICACLCLARTECAYVFWEELEMKEGQVVIREWDDGKVEIGILINYCGLLFVESYDCLFAHNLNKWEVIGEL